MLYNLCS